MADSDRRQDKSHVGENQELSRTSNEEQHEKEIQRATENRLKRGHQYREANHKGSEKYEEVICVLSEFSVTLRLRKIQSFFSQSSFDTSFSL